MRSIHSFRSRTRASSISYLKGRKRRLKLHSAAAAATSGTSSSSTAAMHKRLMNLQKIVIPGRRRSLETDLNHLFQRTADHIFALQLKLNILKDLTSLYGL